MRAPAVIAVVVGAVSVACSGATHHRSPAVGSPSTTAAATTTTTPIESHVLLVVHDGELDAIATSAPFTQQVVVPSRVRDHNGVDARGPVCVDATTPGRVAVGVARPATGVTLLSVHGHGLGDLGADRGPTLASGSANDVVGCAFLADGRLAVAETHASGVTRLVVWPAAADATSTPCTVDDVAVAGSVAARANEVLAVDADATGREAGVWAYELSASCAVVHASFVGGAVAHHGAATAVAAAGPRTWVAMPDGTLVAVGNRPAPADQLATTMPAFGHVAGLAVQADGTSYMTTDRDTSRGGAVWRVSTRLDEVRPIATAWTDAGGVALFAVANG